MEQLNKQNQHKVPQVYLRQFGYLFKEHYKVSVLEIGDNFTRQKSIESFLSLSNIFDIDTKVPEIKRVFEQLNSDIENEYIDIIKGLEEKGFLSEKSYAVLLQLIPNLVVRSDNWRSKIYSLLTSELKHNFLKIICAHHADSFEELETKFFYRIMADNPVQEVINRASLFFMDYLLRRIEHFEIVILHAQEDKTWFTSDNPVVMKNRTAKFEFMTKDSEIYFPISPKFLAYLHYKDSDDKINELRSLKSNIIHVATEKQNWDLQELIMKNADKYIIVSGELKYRMTDKSKE